MARRKNKPNETKQYCEICHMPISMYNKTGVCFHHNFTDEARILAEYSTGGAVKMEEKNIQHTNIVYNGGPGS